MANATNLKAMYQPKKGVDHQRKNSVSFTPSRGGQKLSVYFSQDITKAVKNSKVFTGYFRLEGNYLWPVKQNEKGAVKFQTGKDLAHMEFVVDRLSISDLKTIKKKTYFECLFSSITGKIIIDPHLNGSLIEQPNKSTLKQIVPKPGRGQHLATNSNLKTDLLYLLNWHSREDESNTPDYILAEYLIGCLKSYEKAIKDRREYWGRGD